MSAYSVFSREAAIWIVDPDGPESFRFPAESAFNGWALLSPLMTLEGAKHPVDVMPLIGGRLAVYSDRFDFVVSTHEPEDPPAVAEQILRWLRLVIGQVELGAPVVAWTASASASAERAPLPTHGMQGRPANDVELRAITMERIERAATAHPSCSVPVYAEVLNDAIEASAVGDYRKAILCSAIAVEVMAAARLRELLAEAAAEMPDALRLSKQTTQEGIITEKDPVFEELMGGSRNNFRVLLHSLPIYVRRRSMLEERKDVYDELLRLRETRNSLVHSAELRSREHLPLDEDGARRALTVAISAFDWFNATGRYLINREAGFRRRRLAVTRLQES